MKAHALSRDELINILTVYQGTTTADGLVGGTTLIDADLFGLNDFVTGKTILIMSGAALGETKSATVFAPLTGTITFPAFSTQILMGVSFRILTVDASIVTAILAGLNVPAADAVTNALSRDVIGNKVDAAVTVVGVVASIIAYVKGCLDQLATLITRVGDPSGDTLTSIVAKIGNSATSLVSFLSSITTQTDKLAGAAPGVGTTTANWQSGVATSGEAGADLVTIGANDTRNKVLSFIIRINILTAGANLTVKMFMQINGVEDQVFRQIFIQGTDLNGLRIINGTVGIHEALRVEVQSDNAGDNGLAIAYDYMLEAM